MTTYNTGRPGVFIQEVPLPQVVTLPDTGTAVGALVGVLSKGPSTVPVLLQSWTAFVNTFGPLDNAYPTTWAAFNFFANGGRSLYVQRLAGTGDSASLTLDDSSNSAIPTLTVSAINSGTWGNNLSVEVLAGASAGRFNIVVHNATVVNGRAADVVVETWRDLTLVQGDAHYAPTYINSQSKYIVLTDLGSTSTSPTNIPAAISATRLSGGTDANTFPVENDYINALHLFDPIDNPIIFNLPDAAYLYDINNPDPDKLALSKQIQADAVEYAADRKDAFVIVDVPGGLTPANALSYVSDVANEFSGSSTGNVAAAYYPWVNIPNTLSAAPGALRAQAPGAAMIGQYLATDASRGVFKTPAGYGNRLALAVSTQTQLTNSQLDALNAATYPLNAIRQIPGVGIVVMGGRTLDSLLSNRYINIRRSLNYIEKELKRVTAFAVFENNDSRLWASLRTAVGSFLSAYWQQGGLRGTSLSQAFYVICDETNNTFTDIQNGTVNITVGVAVEYPAEYVVIQLGQITASATV